MIRETCPSNLTIGVVGLGLMGTSITVSLLLAGHKIKAVAPIKDDFLGAPKRLRDQLDHCSKLDLLDLAVEKYIDALTITEDYNELIDCAVVLECVIETAEIKKLVYQKIEQVVSRDTIIGTNTSAIPISILQKLVESPERFLGIHWAEPAYATRFLEITCGELTDIENANWICELAYHWKKEPTVLKKDIRGFITNRLMYAVYREIFHLIETGETTVENADKAFRYDIGSWVTLMGIFRRMDYVGLENNFVALRAIMPILSKRREVPETMKHMVEIGARGIHNLKGLYSYSEEEAEKWEKAFASFNRDILKLAEKYSEEQIKQLT